MELMPREKRMFLAAIDLWTSLGSGRLLLVDSRFSSINDGLVLASSGRSIF